MCTNFKRIWHHNYKLPILPNWHVLKRTMFVMHFALKTIVYWAFDTFVAPILLPNMRIWILSCQLRQVQLTHLIKCQLSDTWDSNWHILVTKQCQLNLNFWTNTGKAQQTPFDYQTANLLHLLFPFFEGMKTTGFYLKK